MYLPRSRALLMSPMMVCDKGIMVPIPSPCTARAPTSHQNPCAVLAKTEATMKTTSPQTKKARLP